MSSFNNRVVEFGSHSNLVFEEMRMDILSTCVWAHVVFSGRVQKKVLDS